MMKLMIILAKFEELPFLFWFNIIVKHLQGYWLFGLLEKASYQLKVKSWTQRKFGKKLNWFRRHFFNFFVYAIYTPATKLGGVYWNHHVRLSVRPSVRPSVCPAAFGFPAHTCFPFTPIIMKLHMQTPHASRMCPIDFEVKRSKVKVTMHKLLKMVSGA